MNKRATSAIVASPVLVGAVTTLIVLIAVFLAYQANRGLPFVPTYDVSVEMPEASNLVPTNAVRSGGFRVGQVKKIRTGVGPKGEAIAIADLNLDKTVDPLPSDTRVTVRQRSSLGLKYLELIPGISDIPIKPGGTIPFQQSEAPVEFDQVLNTFDQSTRDSSRTALQGYGDAFAGRGLDINEALQELPTTFKYLEPVMHTLNEPSTHLDNFFKNIGKAATEASPVADEQARLFTFMANTFAAISRSPRALQETISKGPPTQDVGIASFRVQRPFLIDFTDLSIKLRPAVQTLDRRLPVINSALHVGTPTLRASPTLNRNTEKALRGLQDLVDDPNTLLALKDLRTTTAVSKPLLQFVAPYQTVCSNMTNFFTGLGEHQSQPVQGGNVQRVLIKMPSLEQDDTFGDSNADRPADVPKGTDPDAAKDSMGNDLTKSMAQAYSPAIDAAGHADCQVGQYGFIDGPLNPPDFRYKPANFQPIMPPGTPPPNLARYGPYQPNQPSGGSHTVSISNTPGLAGPTFNGVPSLQAVDPSLRRHGIR